MIVGSRGLARRHAKGMFVWLSAIRMERPIPTPTAAFSALQPILESPSLQCACLPAHDSPLHDLPTRLRVISAENAYHGQTGVACNFTET